MEHELGGLGDRFEKIGHISQVQMPDGRWLSWQMFTRGDPEETRKNAATLVRRLLLDRSHSFVAGRVVQVDHTVVELVGVVQGTATQPVEEGGLLPQSEKG